MPLANEFLDECAEHLARERWEQMRRIFCRDPLPGYDGPPLLWDEVPPDTRKLEEKTMWSMLYRGVIVCTRTEHRINVALRSQPRTPG